MTASELWLNVFFYLFAAGALGGAGAVALSRNIVRSAFALLAVLVSVAAMYAIMKADFIAGAQVLIYVGGILVLIIFAVMLTHRITDVKMSNDSAPGLAAACACFCLLFSIVLILFALPSWRPDPFQREAERIVSGDLELRQWQADGRTGLAAGGATHEEKVVLEVRAPRAPGDGTGVLFQIDEDDQNAKKIPLVNGVARYEVDKPLKATTSAKPDRMTRWKARLVGPSGEGIGSWTEPMTFEVHKGVTLLAARGLSGRYLFAFEVVSVLLLAALVGAAFLARKEVKDA